MAIDKRLKDWVDLSNMQRPASQQNSIPVVLAEEWCSTFLHILKGQEGKEGEKLGIYLHALIFLHVSQAVLLSSEKGIKVGVGQKSVGLDKEW